MDRQWIISTRKVSELCAVTAYHSTIVDVEVPVASTESCRVQYRPDCLTVII